MLSCIIIEDQPPAQRVLRNFIDKMGTMDLKKIFADAIMALEFLKQEPVDLIFLDIHLPKISGMDFLKALTYKPNVILTTAFSEYALESYEYDVTDYLLKPFSFERFVKAVSKIDTPNTPTVDVDNSTGSENEDIFIKSGYELIKIAIKEINYIQSDADYTEIHTPETKYLSQEPLRYWESLFQKKNFIRIHKSYIVNYSKILKIAGNRVYLKDNIKLPIGRVYKERFIKSTQRNFT